MVIDIEVLADKWEEEQKLLKLINKEQIEEEEWCHYSGMPSPKLYENKSKHTKLIIYNTGKIAHTGRPKLSF